MTKNHLYLLMLTDSSLILGVDSYQTGIQSTETMTLDDVIFSNDSRHLPQVKFDQKAFFEQRQLWQALNIKNYQFYFSSMGYFPYFGTIVVEGGKYKNDFPLNGYFSFNNYMNYSTVDEIYKTIETMFNSYNNPERIKTDVYLTEIIINYDTINHIPLKIKYEYDFSPDLAVDGTFQYEISNFKVNKES